MTGLNETFNQYVDKSRAWLRSSPGRDAFAEERDHNHDGQLTAGEVQKAFDNNHDGVLDTTERETLLRKASAAGLDRSEIQVLAASASSPPHLSLFNKNKAGQWEDTAALRQLARTPQQVLPFNDQALPSRDLKAVAVARAGLFRVQEQVGNSCGTTSLSMILKYFQGHTLENSVPTIDRYIRAQGKFEYVLPGGQIGAAAIDGYTAPRDIVTYANQHGLRAGLKNQASHAELRKLLDSGVPCLCLTDWNFAQNGSQPQGAAPDARSLHWVNVIGYQTRKNPESGKPETVYTIANPHGLIQQVSEAEFDQVWNGSGPGLELKIPGGQRIQTGMQRLFVAMVPRDEQATVTAPDGSTLKAGEITIPSGSDGFRGRLAQVGSDLLKKAGAFQDDLSRKGAQLSSEIMRGWEHNGIAGVLSNLWAGDSAELERLRRYGQQAHLEERAVLINRLLEQAVNRSATQQLIYDLLSDTPQTQFPALIAQIDGRQLAERLSHDQQAGAILARIARSEVKNGKTGPKFDAFALQLAQAHRGAALEAFLSHHMTREGQLMHRVPAAVVAQMVQQLLNGVTWAQEETALYHLLQATSWPQFEQVVNRLNMGSVAADLENTRELGALTAWTVELGLRTGQWSSLSEILNQLESTLEYTRADDVLGVALNQKALNGRLQEIPDYIRARLINLLDDVSRLRSAEAMTALAALRAR